MSMYDRDNEQHADYAARHRATMKRVDDAAAHTAHCNQGEYVGSCKYGDADCPALPARMTETTPEAREALSEAAAALEGIIPTNANINHPRWPDSTVVPCDVTLGEFRHIAAVAAKLRAAISALSPPAISEAVEAEREGERAAYDAGLKTLRAYIDSRHDYTIEYMAMGVVQDALRAYRSAIRARTSISEVVG